MRIIKLITIFLILLTTACKKESIPVGQISDSLWLEHKGAQMPILVEGNIESKTLLLILHGGPGGTAKQYNSVSTELSKPLEQRYAVAYWDQRLAGNSKGHFNKKAFTVDLLKEDLDLVIELLRNQYGSDLNIFFLGHSWGGYLGNAYLSTGNNQEKISGWIDVDGAHNIAKLTFDGIDLMQEVAEERLGQATEKRDKWQKVLDYTKEFKEKRLNGNFVLDKKIALEMNTEAAKALNAAKADKLILTKEAIEGESNAYLFQDNSPLTNIANAVNTDKTTIFQEIIAAPLTADLKKITIPSLLIWGKYDFVVAPSLGEEMLQELGTPAADKKLLIFEQSGHSPMDSETTLFVNEVIDFVEKYR